MKNKCPKCGSQLSFGLSNDKWVCTACGLMSRDYYADAKNEDELLNCGRGKKADKKMKLATVLTGKYKNRVVNIEKCTCDLGIDGHIVEEADNLHEWVSVESVENTYSVKDCEVEKTLTCVYCGMAYPEGTTPYGEKILTDHIKVCEKHPMYKLRDALVGLVGASTKEELEKMELVLRATPGIGQDKIVALNAIHALIETA